MDFNLNSNRMGFRFEQAGLQDMVDDNSAKFVPNESAPLVFGTGFNIITDIQRAANGGIYVVSHTDGVVYQVFRKGAATRFAAHATGDQEVPPRASPGTATLDMRVIGNGQNVKFTLSV